MISKMMHQICYGFYWNIKKWSKLGQKIDFWLILWVLILFMLPYILWVIPQDFAKWKTLLRYISMVSFISIAFVVEKLRIFKVFHIDSAFMKWFLLGFFWTLTPANIVQFCWNFDQRYSPIRKTQWLKNHSKFWILIQMERTHDLQFWSIWGPNLPPENQKYC